MFGMPVARQLGGKGAAVERVEMTTHNGTHMDAPWHYHPTMNGGEAAMTIDAVPLDWCMGPGVRLDFRHLPDGHVVTAAEVAAEFDRIGHDLRPGDIVLVNTRAGARYGQPDYVASGCGMGRAGDALARRARRACLRHRRLELGRPPDAARWPACAKRATTACSGKATRPGPTASIATWRSSPTSTCLPGTGFEVMAFPVKIARASAGWCRPVALIPA
jgi:kynurenine formamidase